MRSQFLQFSAATSAALMANMIPAVANAYDDPALAARSPSLIWNTCQQGLSQQAKCSSMFRKMFPIQPSLILLALLVFLLFVVPFFPKTVTPGLYQLLFTAVILVSALTLGKSTKPIVTIAAIIIGIKWALLIYDNKLRHISNIPMVIFFIWMVGKLLWSIAYEPRKNSLVIVDCVNGYFLMALVSAIFISLTSYLSPGSFNFSNPGEAPIQGMNEYIYHALVVFSTTGFGDIIPNTPQAKAISNFISVSGQLYVAIIITLLIGHYSASLHKARSQQQDNEAT